VGPPDVAAVCLSQRELVLMEESVGDIGRYLQNYTSLRYRGGRSQRCTSIVSYPSRYSYRYFVFHRTLDSPPSTLRPRPM